MLMAIIIAEKEKDIKCPTGEWLNNGTFIHGILLCNKKEETIDKNNNPG